MILIDKVLGNIKDGCWLEKSKTLQVDALVLEQWEAPKNRLRKASQGGIELAIALPRDQHLHDGDVLLHDEEKNVIVVAQVALKDVLVIELQGLEKLSPREILRSCFELGHGLGNQHWPAVIKDTTVYVPLSVDQKVMASVMRTHAFEHVKTHFAPGEEIAAKLDAKEVRLLFAGADATPHHHHNHHGGHSHGDHSHDDHSHGDHSHGDHSHGDHSHGDYSHGDHSHGG